MDINRLRYFCTICQTQSLTRAAEFLNLSPAALSKAMKLFEEEVGLELVRPSGRGIVITQEGLRLAEKGRQILEDVEQLPAYAKGQRRDGQELRLGSFEVFTTYLLGELYAELAGSYDLVVHELTPGKIEEALVERKVDLGLTYVPVPHHDLDHLQVGKVRMGVFGLQGKFKNKSLDGLPFAVPVEPLQGSPTKAQGLDGWLPSYGARQVRFKVTLMESALELMRRGLAVAYLPSFVVDLHNEYVQPKYRLEELDFSIKSGNTAPVYLVKRKDEKETALMKKIAKIVRLNLTGRTLLGP